MISKVLQRTHAKSLTASRQRQVKLSNYFPANTVYFYGFPAGEDSGFYNQVPAADEELVSARPLVCADDDMRVLTYAASSDDYALGLLSQQLNILDKTNIVRMPAAITQEVTGAERNQQVKKAINDLLEDNSLVMAQPFVDKAIQSKFRISPDLSVRLSNKSNMQLYVPSRYLPGHVAVFKSGAEFYNDTQILPMPCVAKVANSSSGDGVAVCTNKTELLDARRQFKGVKSKIKIEEFIMAKHNLCIQFGIPYDRSKRPEVIGYNEQVTSKQGDFLGGVVNGWKTIDEFDAVSEVLLEQILPALRDLGWYGVGGIDVLIKEDGNFFFIDPNLRMTATFAYVYLAKTNKIHKPLMSFTGKIACKSPYFETQILPFAKGASPVMTIISLTHQNNIYRFNAGIQFDSVQDLKRKAATLLEAGIESEVLTKILHPDFSYSVY